MDGNEDSVTLASNTMVVGDEGLVVRSFRGRLGGVDQDGPHFSILCDKFEIGPPAGLSQLFEGDFVEMELEYLILPRVGDEYAAAVDNSGSYTLQYLLSNMNTTERVRAQAIGGSLNVTGVIRSRVESNYPVRIAAQGIESTLNGTGVMFDVQGSAIGFVPVVITNLPSPTIAAEQGLWLRPLGEENFTKLQQGADGTLNRPCICFRWHITIVTEPRHLSLPSFRFSERFLADQLRPRPAHVRNYFQCRAVCGEDHTCFWQSSRYVARSLRRKLELFQQLQRELRRRSPLADLRSDHTSDEWRQ